MRPVVVTSAIAAFVAAVAFVFSCADTNGLTGGDESSDAGEEADVDAPFDADGTKDSGTDARGCSHTFCDDFDEEDLATKWSAVFGARGTPTRDDQGPLSPPFALLATVSAKDGGDFRASSVSRTFAATKHVHLAGSVLAAQDLSRLNIIYLRPSPLPTGTTMYEVSLWTGDNGVPTFEHIVTLADGGSVRDTPAFNETFVTWRRLEIDLRFDDSTATLVIDGSQRASVALGAASPTAIEVELGIPYAGSIASAKSVRWDDVTIDVE